MKTPEPTCYLETLTARVAELNDDAALIIFPAGDGSGWNIDLGVMNPETRTLKDVDWLGIGPTIEDAAKAALEDLIRRRDVPVDLNRDDRTDDQANTDFKNFEKPGGH